MKAFTWNENGVTPGIAITEILGKKYIVLGGRGARGRENMKFVETRGFENGRVEVASFAFEDRIVPYGNPRETISVPVILSEENSHGGEALVLISIAAGEEGIIRICGQPRSRICPRIHKKTTEEVCALCGVKSREGIHPNAGIMRVFADLKEERIRLLDQGASDTRATEPVGDMRNKSVGMYPVHLAIFSPGATMVVERLGALKDEPSRIAGVWTGSEFKAGPLNALIPFRRVGGMLL